MKEKNILKKTTKTISDGADQVLDQLKNGLSKIGDLAQTLKISLLIMLKMFLMFYHY